MWSMKEVFIVVIVFASIVRERRRMVVAKNMLCILTRFDLEKRA